MSRLPRAAQAFLLLSTLCPASAWAQSASGLSLEGAADLGTSAEQTQYFNVAGCACQRPVTIEVTISNEGADGGLALVLGRGCVDADQELDADCDVLWTGRVESAPDELVFDTTVDALLGGCEAQDGDLTLSIVADVDDQDQWSELDALTLSVDTRPPDPVDEGEVVAGEGLAVVAYTVQDDEPEAGLEYQVLCNQDGEAVFSSPPAAAFVSAVDVCGASGEVSEDFVCAKATRGLDSVDVLNLKDGVEYTFSVVAVDEAGNASKRVAAGSATPAPEEDLFERYKSAGGAADGGHCFVATAAYGDYGHPQVRTLRAFRDQVLARSEAGRWLIDAYYATSPPMAGLIAEHDSLRTATRAALTPLVWLADLIVEVNP